ncbi:Gfo/Idh/MocA family protein [Gryllotalpicola protaetiae]|uniref:Gfo/Idh/MocA family oxidoreductase n=1 Tax=Gryllotalpicola protaetiae TaxID=2419771 RepID=A0A387BS85_9MICO|nr:Gfo/Idh/MocA family oxidoreductase [Gryllotalpicola protaetiae]AYG03929.1 gfo/Idh/MocA family oxidoreductase [Gryllotalpicola protaetiae]
MTRVNIGVIGTGAIAQAHLTAYSANPEAELVAVSDLNLDRAQSAADTYGVRRAYGDPNELLADPEVDAVSICTWNDSHARWAIAALEAGKHVLVEKPMSRSYAEAIQMERAVAASGRVLQVGFVRRHSPNAEVLKSFIDNGDLGDIYYARASVIRRVGNPGGWFADKAISGGGPLIDIGIHVIDLCWYLMGAPNAISVSANLYSRLGNRAHITTLPRWQVSDYDPEANGVEDMVNALVRFDNGASMLVEASYSLHAVRDSIGVSVFGEKGGAELEPQLEIATEKYGSVVNLVPQISSLTFEGDRAFANEIGNFIDAIQGKAESIAPVSHGAELTKILESIYASAESGQEIRL